ncbi:MAG TPA: hypothetical protein VL383_01030 [Gemmatimonadaceae bacterium]|nr:hypothetical protein [Gemmatimonadaceae bacterium]
MASHSTKPQRVAFSRPFSDLLVELSIALQKFVMYPDGHPLLEPAAAAVVRRAERIMEDRPTIAFGVARHQLIIEGVATDPKQPVLRRLADSLNRHHLGAISLSRGVKPNEIAEALRQVGAETNTVVPIGLRPLHELPSWPHLRLHPLTFDRLALVTDGSATAAKSADDTRAMELWIGLATAAMTTGRPQDGSPVPTEPAVIARAIDEHERVEAYDQVIVGYLQQIARELKAASSAESAALRRRTARLLASLKPETVRHLVEMGGDFAQRRAFVLDAAHGMAVDSVLGIVQAAADASGQVISRGLIRMLTKLAMHAEAGPPRAREMASGALREQIDQLMTGWELTDPIPAEHSRLLHRLATEESPQLSRAEGDRAPDGDSDLARIVQMSLEVDSTGILLDQAIDRAVDEGAVETILNLLVSAPSGSGATIDAILTRLTHPDSIARLVAREPVDVESLEQLLPLLSIDAHRILLDALSNTENRRTRRKLLDLLARAEADIAPLAIERLADERWFVQRNMLVLLCARHDVPSSFSAEPWTTHPDVRVSYEAIRLQLAIPGERTQAIRASLAAADPRSVRLGLAAVQEECPSEVAGDVVNVAKTPDAPEELRTLAVRALRHVVPASHDPRILDVLLATADGGTTLLGRTRLAPPTSRTLAALAALNDHWSNDARASTLLALARASEFPDVRRAAGGTPSAA